MSGSNFASYDGGPSISVSRSKENVGKLNNEVGISRYPEKRWPTKRALSEATQIMIDEWFEKTGVKLGKLIDVQKNKVTKLLYTYEDLNSTDLENLPYTDLYVHRVWLKEETPPISRLRQRR